MPLTTKDACYLALITVAKIDGMTGAKERLVQDYKERNRFPDLQGQNPVCTPAEIAAAVQKDKNRALLLKMILDVAMSDGVYSTTEQTWILRLLDSWTYPINSYEEAVFDARNHHPNVVVEENESKAFDGPDTAPSIPPRIVEPGKTEVFVLRSTTPDPKPVAAPVEAKPAPRAEGSNELSDELEPDTLPTMSISEAWKTLNESQDPDRRIQSVDVLANALMESGVEPLLACLERDPNPDVRRAIRQAIIQLAQEILEGLAEE